jgi:hypothetical protein
MVVLVTSRIRQALARSTFYSNVVGDSMLARLRSTTIALLGVVTAVGLGLVAFISQLGFPGVFNGAIPDGQGGSVAAVHGAIALTPGVVGTAHPARGGRIAGARIRLPLSPSPHAPRSAAGPHLGSLNQAGHVPPTGQPPAEHTQPPSATPPEPAAEPVPTPEAPAPLAASPKSEQSAHPEKSRSKLNTQSGGHSEEEAKGHSGEKAKGQADAKPVASSTGGSKRQHSAAKAKQHSGVPRKPTGGSPGNSGESSASPAKGSRPAPPADPGEKMPPEAEGKENGGAGKNGGKSGKSHH